MIDLFIADDHQMVREGLKALLELEGNIRVIGESGSGTDTIRQVKKLQPDVLVLDIEMPGLSGIEVASEIYGSSEKTRILALSRHSEAQYVAEMFAAGASGYILKDSAADELINAIGHVMQDRKFCSPSLMNIVINNYAQPQLRSTGSPLRRLTPRELEVLQLIVDGLSLKEIADELHISYPTAATHRQQILKKLGIQSDIELAKLAIREGLTTL